jgi:hypothetical protein
MTIFGAVVLPHAQSSSKGAGKGVNPHPSSTTNSVSLNVELFLSIVPNNIITMTAAKIVTVLGLLASLVTADIVFENEAIVASDVFDLKYAIKSDVVETSRNATKYYCVFRSLWTEQDHPNDYPDLARYSTPVIFSHTKQYTPFLKNRDANYGVEILAEVCTYSTSIYLAQLSNFKRCFTHLFLFDTFLIITARFYDQVPGANSTSWRVRERLPRRTGILPQPTVSKQKLQMAACRHRFQYISISQWSCWIRSESRLVYRVLPDEYR